MTLDQVLRKMKALSLLVPAGDAPPAAKLGAVSARRVQELLRGIGTAFYKLAEELEDEAQNEELEERRFLDEHLEDRAPPSRGRPRLRLVGPP